MDECTSHFSVKGKGKITFTSVVFFKVWHLNGSVSGEKRNIIRQDLSAGITVRAIILSIGITVKAVNLSIDSTVKAVKLSTDITVKAVNLSIGLTVKDMTLSTETTFRLNRFP
jgi:hypothetical protein